MNKNSSVSIVIPVYNEAAHLGACLRAIAAQTVAPLEVIVVDNNSSDATAAIAASFPFVTLLREKRQGVVFARDRGFNAARGGIIGRIDADTLLPADWTKCLQTTFKDNSIAAVSGSLHYYDIAASKAIDNIDTVMRGWMARHMGSYTFLLGSNMAIRKSVWRAVRASVCRHGNMHEDLDLAVHLGGQSQKVIYDANLRARVSARRIDVTLAELSRYMFLSPKTYAHHQIAERKYMYPLILIVFMHYVHLRFLFRGFNSDQQRFSWRTVFSSGGLARVNPATFVD